MELERLRTFYFVAKLKSFTKAAKYLALTQPAVSLQIKALENEYGTTLFERRGKEVILTESGKVLITYAEKILSAFEEMKLKLKKCGDPLCGKVSFGASILTAIYLLPSILGKFRRLYPQVQFTLRVRYAEEILEFLAENQVNFGIMGEGNRIDERSFDIEQLLEDELVFVMPPGHPFQARVSLEMVLAQELILPEEYSALRKYIDRQMGKLGVTLQPYIEVGNIEVVKKLVEQNFGCSILPSIAVRDEVEAGRLRTGRIEGLPLKRKILLVKKRGKILSPSEEFFIQFLKKELSAFGQSGFTRA
ncbi:MAG: Putative [NiFe] hydrogenase, gamma subunit [Thermotoga sp. 50_1627]|uniref:LysR family transcriptional regulator n=1 Tax=Pseudothermotoga sp. TaxID=2033661 RepID=UPI00076BD8E1|nr:MAG: Putative [NiFe] hydrogenase, gamma subunit [Thermotoga sp. 50_1627]MBC7116688.1 LysR family transcriptional regulator [Pseudothermotoga sp.]MDK2922731.1 LysR family transcriptional regulator, transcriptional activator of the cysJI operon [Pseudothermotoga sp.]HBT39275.1 hypothetical protein [Pseudothermotoga sp.]HCO97619.1 hypothetical protein [Pseudothermotoga sp.]